MAPWGWVLRARCVVDRRAWSRLAAIAFVLLLTVAPAGVSAQATPSRTRAADTESAKQAAPRPSLPAAPQAPAAPGGAEAAGKALPASETAHVIASGPDSQHNVARDLLIMLLAAGFIAMVLQRVRLATIPCYLITGALIGPTALRLITDDANIQSISSLAVVLLMFTIGLHLNPSELRGGGMIRVLSVGVASTVAVIGALWPYGALLTGSAPKGLAVSMALAMSSTAVTMRILSETRQAQRILGRLCIGIAITQDLISLAALASMPLLAAWAGTTGAGGEGAHSAFLLPEQWPALAKAGAGLFGIAVFIYLGYKLLPRLVLEASRGSSSEIALVFSAGAALLAAVVAAGFGLSPELGAFIAGFLLASTPARHQLAGQLSPLRDLFMAVFFTAVGLKLDFRALADGWLWVLVGTASVIIVKTLVISVSAWALGATAPLALRAATLLGQAGEFTIVVLSAASAVGLVSAEANSRLIAIVVLSLIIVPILYKQLDVVMPWVGTIKSARWNAPAAALADTGDSQAPSRRAPGVRDAQGLRATANSAAAAAPTSTPEAASPHSVAARGRLPRHVIIAGFGVVGRSLADRLDLIDVPFTIVDMNQGTINTQTKLGRTAVYGDISNLEVLESAGIGHADAVMLTIPDDEATLRACKIVREHRGDVYIAARTSFLSKAMQAMQLGADMVVVEEVATAEAMARQVMDAIVRRAAAKKTTVSVVPVAL